MLVQTIKNRWTGAVLDEREAATRKEALEAAHKEGGSNLRGSDLSGSNLRGSDLRDSNLRGSDLSGSDLRGSDLRGSNLSEKQLRSANLVAIRDDLWAVLGASPKEVEGLRLALVEGRIDGSCYQGECSCLCGTLATVAHADVWDRPVLKPNSNRPAERWFLAIEPGHTPENSPFVLITVEWIDQWLAAVKAAFGAVIASETL